MSGDNVVYLRGQPRREIAQYVRVGFLEHGTCEQLLASRKLVARRFVIDAANFQRQHSLVQTLRNDDAEIVLDTNAAELSVLGRFSGSAKDAPWAVKGRPLEHEEFLPATNRSIIGPIARY